MTIEITAWDTDIEAALLSLTSEKIADREYWFATVDRIEEGRHPHDNKRLTVAALNAWVERCKQEPTEDDLSTDPTSRDHTPHRRVLRPRS